MSRPQPRPASVDEVLEHAEWVRRLALGLVGNEAAADDLTQEALLRAIERPPAAGGSLKAWLARVLRNLAIDHGRRRQRRQAREHKVGEGREVEREIPEPGDIQARLELQEGLAQAVRELPEPYRTTTVLYYFDNLGTEEIAARLDVQSSTVRNQLSRARMQLRKRLERRYGGEWRALCIGLLLRPSALPPPPPPPGVPVGLAAGLAASVLLAGAWMLASLLDAPPVSAASPGGETVAQAPAAPPVEAGASREASATDAALADGFIGLQLVGPAGGAVADAEVRAYGYRWADHREVFPGPEAHHFDRFPLLESARADDAGRVPLRSLTPDASGRVEPSVAVVVDAPGFVKRAFVVQNDADGRQSAVTVALRPAAYASVRVLDEAGRPVADARVTPIAPRNVLHEGHFHRVTVRTDDDGYARFANLPPETDVLTVSRAGYRRVLREPFRAADTMPERDHVVVLARGGRASLAVHAWDGSPFAGAEVYLEQSDGASRQMLYPWSHTFAGRTGEDGFLDVGGIDWDRRCSLIVKVDGVAVETEPLREGEHTTVHLPPLTRLSGQVVRHDGAPAAHALVGTFQLEGEDKRAVAHAWTDADGGFALHVEAGLQGFGVWHGSGSLVPEQPMPVAPGPLDLGTLQLPRGRELIVDVRDEDGNRLRGPLRLVQRKPVSVASTRQAVEPGEWRDFLTTGAQMMLPVRLADGRFRVSYLPDGPHDFSVVSAVHQPQMITLDPRTAPDVTTVRLQRAVPVELTLTRTDGRPLQGVRVVLYRDDFDWEWAERRPVVRPDSVPSHVMTDDAGRAVFGRVGPGLWHLTLADLARTGIVIDSLRVPEEGLRREIVVREPARIALDPLVADQLPEDTRVVVHTAASLPGRPGDQRSVRVDASSGTVATEAAAGEQRVDVTMPGSLPRTRTVTTGSGEESEVEVDVDGTDLPGRFAGGARIGRILLMPDAPDEMPERDAIVAALRDAVHHELGGFLPSVSGEGRGLPFALTAADAEGRFLFRALPNGRYRMYGTGPELQLAGPVIVRVLDGGFEVLGARGVPRLVARPDAPVDLHVDGLVRALARNPSWQLWVGVQRLDGERDSSYVRTRHFRLLPERNGPELTIDKEPAGRFRLSFRLIGDDGVLRAWEQRLETAPGERVEHVERLESGE